MYKCDRIGRAIAPQSECLTSGPDRPRRGRRGTGTRPVPEWGCDASHCSTSAHAAWWTRRRWRRPRRARPIAREPLKEDAEQDPGDRQGLSSDAAEQVFRLVVSAPQTANWRRCSERAKSSPVQSATKRTCWRASSVPAKALIQTTSETGSHCVSSRLSSHESVAYPTTAYGESRLFGRTELRPGRLTATSCHCLSDYRRQIYLL